MLEIYKEEQENAYKILNNNIEKNKISHAYLLISNNYCQTFEFAKSFIKSIINKQDKSCEEKENLFYKIDNNIFLDLKIIENDGLWIKKEQIEELQKDFVKKPIENEKKFYIIKEVEKFNKSAANSILKFLEDPEPNIIAIFITNNINQVMETIASRCIKIQLKCSSINSEEEMMFKISKNILTENKNFFFSLEEIEFIINFIKFLEENKKDTLLHVNRLWHVNFKEREVILHAFDIIILFYYDVLIYILKEKINIFDSYENFIKNIVEKNDYKNIIEKINIFIEHREKIKFNININLLMDKLIIKISEVNQ